MGHRRPVTLPIHGQCLLPRRQRCPPRLRHHPINIFLKPLKMDQGTQELRQLRYRMSDDREQVGSQTVPVHEMYLFTYPKSNTDNSMQRIITWGFLKPAPWTGPTLMKLLSSWSHVICLSSKEILKRSKSAPKK
jgi:hypothetical protein